MKFGFKLVDSHQYEKCSFEDLYFPSKLNAICDESAQGYLESLGSVSLAMSMGVTLHVNSLVTDT